MADTIRNVEDLNLDDIDEELLTDQAIAMGKALGVDTREGSVYMDAAAGHISRTAEFLSYLAEIRDVTSIFTATGEVLDEYLSSRGLTRVPAEATSAVYLCKYTGSAPTVGATVIVDEYEFTVTSVNETASTALITSTDTGTDMNSFVSGTAVIPEDGKGHRGGRLREGKAPYFHRYGGRERQCRAVQEVVPEHHGSGPGFHLSEVRRTRNGRGLPYIQHR